MARWIAWTLLTIIAWGVWAILCRFTGDALTPAQSQVISTLGIFPILLGLWLMSDSQPSGNSSWGIALALGSGILSCLGNVAYYGALNESEAATVIPLTAMYPVVTVLLAMPLLKERVTPIQLVGIALSLVAIYIFNVPAGTEEPHGLISKWMLLPLAAVVLWGITGLMQKIATDHLSARSCALWFLMAFIPVAGLILLYVPWPAAISAKTWLLTVALGFALALGNYTLLLAFASGGKASIIVPLAGLYPLVSIPIAIWKFDERPGGREILGIALALIAVVLLSLQSEPEKSSNVIVETDTTR